MEAGDMLTGVVQRAVPKSLSNWILASYICFWYIGLPADSGSGNFPVAAGLVACDISTT